MRKQPKVAKEKIKAKIKEIKSSKLFFIMFFKALKEEKMFLLSFIITVISIISFTTFRVGHSEGLFSFKNNLQDDNGNETTITTLETKEQDIPDVSDYVGIYSKEIKLDKIININDTCSIDSYKYIYQVKKDRSINKYFYNSCIGVIRIWQDTLEYNKSGGAKYISANDINFTFYDNTIKEVDGDIYKVDEDIINLKENKLLEEVDLSFYGDNIVFMTNTNLILIETNIVSTPITDYYQNNGGDLEKRFYKSNNIKYQYNFIVFRNGENVSCYDSNEEDSPLYSIYSIRYDVNSNNFLSIKEIVTRSKSDSCKNYKEDLETLRE